MADPRTLEEVEIPDRVVNLHPSQPQQQREVSPAIYQAIAAVVVGKLHAALLILAIIALSAWAVIDPIPLRLIAAGGFDLLAIGCIALITRK